MMRLSNVTNDLRCIKSTDGRHEWIQENRFVYKCTKCGAIDDLLD